RFSNCQEDLNAEPSCSSDDEQRKTHLCANLGVLCVSAVGVLSACGHRRDASMKSTRTSRGKSPLSARRSTGPRETVKIFLVAAGLCGIANRQLRTTLSTVLALLLFFP